MNDEDEEGLSSLLINTMLKHYILKDLRLMTVSDLQWIFPVTKEFCPHR